MCDSQTLRSDFAPAPCFLFECLIPETLKQRTYAHVYENRIEWNLPCAPCCCMTTEENCIVDNVQVRHFDRLPSRVGMCCGCIPFTCCGPPAVFTHQPKLFCLDMQDYCGNKIKVAPSNYYGLKMYLCCGNPCYTQEACQDTLLTGIKNPEAFLSAWKVRRSAPHDVCFPQSQIFRT